MTDKQQDHRIEAVTRLHAAAAQERDWDRRGFPMDAAFVVGVSRIQKDMIHPATGKHFSPKISPDLYFGRFFNPN